MVFNVSDIKKVVKSSNQKDLFDLLRDCPTKIMKDMEIKTFKKNHILMSAGDFCDSVYILMDGSLIAIDENVPSAPYNFQYINAVDVVGDYEAFGDTKERFVTLKAASEITCIEMSTTTYIQWMQEDVHALFKRTTNLVNVLAPQMHYHRQFMFVNNETKFILFVISRIEANNVLNFPYTIKDSKQVLTSYIGCSERTLNRVLVTLENRRILSRIRGKITIDRTQYELLKRFINESEINLNLQSITSLQTN